MLDPAAIVGYAAALLIGTLLGIVGGGGAILTLPTLTYLFAIPPVEATTYSLFIVGVTSAIGAARYARYDLVDYRAAWRFALPAFAAIHLVRKLLVPALPAAVTLWDGVTVTKDAFVMVVLTGAMLASAYVMLRQRKLPPGREAAAPQEASVSRTSARGFAVGVLTGLVGAGGGFLLVPALAVMERLPMKRAVATSLFVIALNSFFGFAGDVYSGKSVEWSLLLVFTLLSGMGMIVGSRLSRKISDRHVRTFFGWLLVVMSIVIILQEARR